MRARQRAARWTFADALSICVLFGLAACAQAPAEPARPNIVYILADDLGYGEVGAYGQEVIRTPSLDRLAREGMRLTQHYSGSAVCAPSRGSLLTGLHTGHAYIRDNDEMAERGDVWRDPELEGQRPLPEGTTTIGHLLQRVGYETAAIGKWGLGWTGSSGDPNRQGFDHFFGYICQRVAHNHYPTHLWRNGVRVPLDNEPFHAHQAFLEGADPNDPASYERYSGAQYAHDLLTDEALEFVRRERDQPFFLYLPYTIPHVALQVPEDTLAEYDHLEDEPYLGDNSYLPHRRPRAAYAAMITRMDRDIGRLLDLLDELGLAESTVVLFSSDNGPTYVSGVDREFFASSGGLRGRKGQLYEGGIRVPMIVRWPGRVAAGSQSDLVSAFWDVLPTLTELAGAQTPAGLDGFSMLPTLLGRDDEQRRHDYLYWEHARSWQAIRQGDWKAVRKSPAQPLELYHLARDPTESTDLAPGNPDLIDRLERLMVAARTESALFPLSR